MSWQIDILQKSWDWLNHRSRPVFTTLFLLLILLFYLYWKFEENKNINVIAKIKTLEGQSLIVHKTDSARNEIKELKTDVLSLKNDIKDLKKFIVYSNNNIFSQVSGQLDYIVQFQAINKNAILSEIHNWRDAVTKDTLQLKIGVDKR